MSEAYALVASASANSVLFEPDCIIPRRLTVEGVSDLLENDVCCDIAKSGMASLVAAADPPHE